MSLGEIMFFNRVFGKCQVNGYHAWNNIVAAQQTLRLDLDAGPCAGTELTQQFAVKNGYADVDAWGWSAPLGGAEHRNRPRRPRAWRSAGCASGGRTKNSFVVKPK